MLMIPDTRYLSDDEIDEEITARYGTLFHSNDRQLRVRTLDTQVGRIRDGDLLGYPRLDLSPDELTLEKLRCERLVAGATCMGIAESRPELNNDLFSRSLLAVGRTWRLKMCENNDANSRMWRQARALLFVHYDFWPPEEPVTEPDDDVLSMEVPPESLAELGTPPPTIYGEPRENLLIEVVNAESAPQPQATANTNAANVTIDTGKAPPRPSIAPLPRTFTGAECLKCFTWGHDKKTCPYRRYRPLHYEYAAYVAGRDRSGQRVQSEDGTSTPTRDARL